MLEKMVKNTLNVRKFLPGYPSSVHIAKRTVKLSEELLGFDPLEAWVDFDI